MAQESRLEKWAKKEAEKRGWLSFKFVSPSQVGVPDRIFIAPINERGIGHGVQNIVFIEFKAPFRKPTKLQSFWIDALRSCECLVYVVDNKQAVLDIFKAYEQYNTP
jgi:hypothetical protein